MAPTPVHHARSMIPNAAFMSLVTLIALGVVYLVSTFLIKRTHR